MSEVEKPFELKISLNVLEHLGINLYSNVPSVLSEIVANAWDADATQVRVDWDRPNGRIVIQDDGIGMNPQEVNDRFLTVGYRRRDGQPGVTAKGRRPMGRKGIGKLSLFSIADVVQIETIKEGDHPSTFRMCLSDIRQKIEEGSGSILYHPEVMENTDIDFSRGTRITLTELHKRQTIRTAEALRKRVARRFSVVGPAYDFHVFIDGEEVQPFDRGYYDKIQYLWTYGDESEIRELCVNTEQSEERSQAVANAEINVTGWLGTVAESGQLRDDDGENLNRIPIFVRGKMAQENMLDDFSERGVYASYLIGELRFDDLDTYDGQGTVRDEDAATSSRQSIVEDDPRYQALRRFLGDELKYIQGKWSEWRTEAGTRRAIEIPAVKDWIEGLSTANKKKAKKWLGKINRIRLDDAKDQKQLIKHAVLAFEFYKANANLEALDSIDDESLPTALEIFQELDNLEANLYGQIVHQRVKVIQALREKVDQNALEKVIQQYLFEHLWLLDPAWERAEGTEFMESRVKKMFEDIDAKLTDNERSGRLDIAYRKTAGQHVIIELKRPERTVSVYSELVLQVTKYRNGMQRLLDKQRKSHEPVEIVLLLGKIPTEVQDPVAKKNAIQTLAVQNARIVYYDELLENAGKAYQDYFDKRKLVDKLAEVMAAIDDYAATESS
jgi:signal transduction histidine kinase